MNPKKLLPLLFLIFISSVLYLFTIRGSLGNPSPYQIEYEFNSSGKPFETSQERSRWALILSLVKNHSFNIDEYASMGTPDIGRINNHYYSFFPPGTSILAVPLYLLGERFGISQIAVFLTSTLFTLGTMIIIYLYCQALKLHWSAGLFGALGYGFATSVWGYSVTLFAHPISAFFILLGVYLVSFPKTTSFIRACVVWIIYSILLYVDFPNVFIYFPVVLYLTLKGLSLSGDSEGIRIKINILRFLSPFIFIASLGLYGYYNYIHFGSPIALSNSIPRVQDLKDINKATPEKVRNSGQSLNSRNFVNGLFTFTISHDRGILIYTPVILLFIFGLNKLKDENSDKEVLLLSVPLVCFVLYCMFGDPYGGWAFGSRYLVAIMPELMILAAIGLASPGRRILARVIYSLVTIYSASVVLLAPLTTNVIPPYVEARTLGLDSDYSINIRMLKADELNSFFYNQILRGIVPGTTYYFTILIPLSLILLIMIWYPRNGHKNKK